MSDRTCPECKSTEHFLMYGIIGTYVTCECGVILACRRDEAAAPTDHPDPEAWAMEGRWVLPGAEAVDPTDDRLFTPLPPADEAGR